MSDDTPATEEPEVEAEAEAEVDAENEAEAEAPKGLKGKLAGKMKFVLIGVAALVILCGGAGAYFSVILHPHNPHEVPVKLPDPPVYQDIARITVDLKPSAKRARPFIRLTMQAELQGESARAAFIANETKIMDAMQSYLRNTPPESLEGINGTETLRTDLTTIINRIIAPEVAITVLYKDLIIR